jgi:NAD-specific glutamate dehydrogenase
LAVCSERQNHLAKNHGGDLLRRKRLLLAKIVNLHNGVSIAVDDLERPGLDILLDGLVLETAADETPIMCELASNAGGWLT